MPTLESTDQKVGSRDLRASDPNEHTTPTVLVIVQLLLDKAQVVMGFGDLGVVGPVGRSLMATARSRVARYGQLT